MRRDAPRVEVANPTPAINDAGGEVYVRAVWRKNHINWHEAEFLEKWLKEHPEHSDKDVYAIKLLTDPGYGVNEVTVNVYWVEPPQS